VFHIPKRLTGKDTIPQVRANFIKAIGEAKVKAVQALPENKIRVEFKSPSLRHQCDINGISFRGVTLTPFPAYEEIKKVFVDRAPLQMPDNYILEALAPYGRVLSVQHLTVRGFLNIKSGTRMVSMSVNKAIPAETRVAGFTLSFKYRGQPRTCFVCQEVGHTARNCPKSRAHAPSSLHKTARSNTTSLNGTSTKHKVQKPPSSSAAKSGDRPSQKSKAARHMDDLRDHLNVLRASFGEPSGAPPSVPSGTQSTQEVSLSRDTFDLDIPVSSPPQLPASSPWSDDFSRGVTITTENRVEVTVNTKPKRDKQPRVRALGKTARVSSDSEDSEVEGRNNSPSVSSKSRPKRLRRIQPSSGSASEIEIVHESRFANKNQFAALSTDDPEEDALDGSNVIDPVLSMEEEMPIDESPSPAEVTGVTSPQPPSPPFVAESQDSVSLTSQTLSQSVPHSEASDAVNIDHAGSDSDSLFDGLDDFRAVFGSDGESLVSDRPDVGYVSSALSTTSSVVRVAEVADLVMAYDLDNAALAAVVADVGLTGSPSTQNSNSI
jgi:hypothetical protein